jgi:hypothetical protein
MRLRPSGRQGPVAVALPSFRRYQAEEAWTWEHLALTRARVVAGPPDLAERASPTHRRGAPRPHDAGQGARRRRRHAPPPRRGARGRRRHPWELKLGPGRMMDIELARPVRRADPQPRRQRRPRQMLGKLATLGWIGNRTARRSRARSTACRRLQQIGRLAADHTIDPAEGGQGLVQLVLETTAPRISTPARHPRAGRLGLRRNRHPPARRALMLPIVWHPDYLAPLRPGHRFPMSKYGYLRAALIARAPAARGRRLHRPRARPHRPGRRRACARLRRARRRPAPDARGGTPHRPARHRRRRPARLPLRRRHPARRAPRARARPRLQRRRRLASRRPRGRRRLLRLQRRRHRRARPAGRGRGPPGPDRRLRRASGRRHRPHLRRAGGGDDPLAACRAQLSRAQGPLASRLSAARPACRTAPIWRCWPMRWPRPRRSAPTSSSTTPASIRMARTASAGWP